MPNDSQAGVKPKVEIDGSPLQGAIADSIEQVIVDQHLHQPDMFLLSFRDEKQEVAQQAHIQIGSKVKISGPSPSTNGTELLIDGEVTAIEADYGSHGSRSVVRGYDEIGR